MSELLKIPGMMDPHVHLRGMDWSHKGTFSTETAAALAGGYTAVLDMPNTSPPTITPQNLDYKLGVFASQAHCDWGVYYGASSAGNWEDYPAVIDSVCGLKMYNNETTGHLLIEDQAVRAAHYQAWPAHKVIAVHAEGETVAQILDLVRQYGRKTHFCHISTAEEITMLRAAKEEGLPVTVGVCPHHLYLSQDDLPTLGPLGLMKPELKTRADVAALWEALAGGVVDVIESDHAPHTLAEKHSGKPVYGVPGLETNLPLSALAVKEGRLTVAQLVDLLAVNPRRIFGVAADPETYTLVDLDAAYTLESSKMLSHCGWTPFDGMRVYGVVRQVVIRGQIVYDGEKVLVEAGFGERLDA